VKTTGNLLHPVAWVLAGVRHLGVTADPRLEGVFEEHFQRDLLKKITVEAAVQEFLAAANGHLRLVHAERYHR
jgi:hypothetical protein